MTPKTRKNGTLRKGIHVKRVTVKGQPMVMLQEAEFNRLLQEADLFEPLLPAPDANGNYPAEVIGITLALRIVRHRRKAGLTQKELAHRAGIRQETLNRIEQGHRSPSTRTIQKIDNILCALVEETPLVIPEPNGNS